MKKFIALIAIIHSVASYTANVPNNAPKLSAKKCNEYYKSNAKSFDKPKTNRIESTENYEFPYMAAVGRETKHGQIDYKCGGVLISPNFVVTAAHCALFNSEGNPADVVLLGETNLEKSKRSKYEIPIKKCIVHPSYHKGEQSYDIALLELEHSAHSKHTPVCLWNDPFVDETEPTFIFYEKIGDSEISKLVKARKILTPNDKCNNFYQKYISKGIANSQICAEECKAEDCRSFASGPLLIHGSDHRLIPHVVGISSFGATCTDKIVPSVYTRISSYIDWIEEHVWAKGN